MNFGGLGFTLSAVDKGLKSALSSTYAGFARVGEAVQGFGRATRESLSGMADVFRPFGAEAMDSMAEGAETFATRFREGMTRGQTAVGTLGTGVTRFGTSAARQFTTLVASVTSFTAALTSRALSAGMQALGRGMQTTAGTVTRAVGAMTAAPTNLTTAMEATAQHNSESARVIGVNYGMLGRDLRRFTGQAAGMADSLNIPVDRAAQAVRGFSEAGAEMRAVGITSAGMLARFSSVTGASSDLLRNTLLQGRREFGMNDAQLQELMHTTVAYGRLSGDVTGALNGMTETMTRLRTVAAQSGVAMSPERMQMYARGTQRAAAMLFTFGQNADDARQGANQIATALLGAERQIQGMLAGTQNDLPALASELGIATGDIQSSFTLMQSGPDGFMQGLTRMVGAARATGRPMGAAMNTLLQRLTGGMDQAGADRIMTYVQQTMAQGTAGVDRAVAQMGERQNLSAMAAAHSTGRTQQEVFERMQQRFTQGFRGLSARAVGPFMADTQRAFTQFNAGLHSVVAQGGPMAELVTRLSLVHRLGAVALLPPDVRPFATALGSVGASMAPAVTALGAMGLRLGMLFNPFALIAVAIAYVAVQFGALYARTHNAGKAFLILQDRISGFVTRAAAFVERLVPQIIAAMPMVLGAIMRIVRIAVPAALRIGAALLRGLGRIGEALIEWAAHYDWAGFVASLVAGLQRVMSAAQAMGQRVFALLNRVISAVDWNAVSSLLGSFLWSMVVRAAGLLYLGLRVLGNLLWPGLVALGELIGRGLARVPALVRDALAVIGPLIMRGLQALPALVLRVVWWAAEAAGRGVVALVGLVRAGLARLPGLVASIGPMLVAAAGRLRDVILGMFDGIRRWLVERFPQAAGVINTVFGVIRTVVTAVFAVIQTTVSTVWGVITAIIRAIVPVVLWVGETIWGIIYGTFTRIRDAVVWIGGLFASMWNDVSASASAAWTWIMDNFVTPLRVAFAPIGTWLRETFGGAITWIREAFGSVVDWFQQQIDRIGGAIRTVRGWLPGGNSGPDPAAQRAAMAQLTAQITSMTVAQRDAWEAQHQGMASAARRQYGHIAALLDATTDTAARAQTASTAAVQNIAANAQTATAAVMTQAQTAAATVSHSVNDMLRGGAAGSRELISRLSDPAVMTGLTGALTRMSVAERDVWESRNSDTAQAIRTRYGHMGAILDSPTQRVMPTTSAVPAGMPGMPAGLNFDPIPTRANRATTAAGAQTLATEIGGIFTTTISQSVSTAFIEAFGRVVTYVQTMFIRKMTDLFTRLITTVNQLFYRFLIGLLNAVDLTFTYLTEQVDRIAASVARATQALATVQAQQQIAAAAAAPGQVIDARSRDLGARSATNDDLYNAIMHPNWYETDYKGLFVNKMDALIDAVRTTTRGGAGASGGRGGRPDAAIARGLGGDARTSTATPPSPVSGGTGIPNVAPPSGAGSRRP